MHDCPICQMVCDCDGEDIWWGYDSEAVEDCIHDCDEDDCMAEDLSCGPQCSPVPPGAQAEQRGRYERERRLLEVNAALIKACTGFVLWERSSFESGKPREANLLVRALVDCHKALQLVSENYVTPGAQSGESEPPATEERERGLRAKILSKGPEICPCFRLSKKCLKLFDDQGNDLRCLYCQVAQEAAALAPSYTAEAAESALSPVPPGAQSGESEPPATEEQ